MVSLMVKVPFTLIKRTHTGRFTVFSVPGGTFCGCFYVKDENRCTDWFVDRLYTPKGFFTAPYETANSLRTRLNSQYGQVSVETVEAMACFTAKKGD